MNTYIAILRGINVSGHKMIKMPQLVTLFESLHFKNVMTYIQSGNVVFQDNSSDIKRLEKKIEEKIAEQFGFEVPVMVKEKNELISVIENNPFVNTRAVDLSKLHVTFLSQNPEQSNINKIEPDKYKPDEFVISGAAIYLFCPGGYGNTKLNNNFFESKLKVTATTRNWKTVNELVNK